MLGFTYPFITPGGYYDVGGWWEIDTGLAVIGAKWVSQAFGENVMRGFHDLQSLNPDGRIDLWGNSAVRGQVADQSQLPTLFEPAFDMARRTADVSLRENIYGTMKGYLDWWLSPVKRDVRTGLITSTYEETFGDVSQAA